MVSVHVQELFPHSDGIKMPGALGIRFLDGKNQFRQTRECKIISSYYLLTSSLERFYLTQLCDAQRCLKFSHVIPMSQALHVVRPISGLAIPFHGLPCDAM